MIALTHHAVAALVAAREERLHDPHLAVSAQSTGSQRTWNAAMPTMSADSPMAKSEMRQAVDETVERLRESRVRKYFCVRWIEESEPESL